MPTQMETSLWHGWYITNQGSPSTKGLMGCNSWYRASLRWLLVCRKKSIESNAG